MQNYSTITWRVSAMERLQMQVLMEKMHRSTISDLLRALVAEAHQKILAGVASKETTPPPVKLPKPREEMTIADWEDLQERTVPKDGAYNED